MYMQMIVTDPSAPFSNHPPTTLLLALSPPYIQKNKPVHRTNAPPLVTSLQAL